MTMTPTVSVVIPAHNAAATISATIRSVLDQTYQAVEVIVIDDGSTDDTAECVRSFNNDSIRYVAQPRQGPSRARNRGVAEARGELVAFLDADDLWLRRKLELQVAAIRREPQIHAVQCSAYLVNNALEVVETRPCHPRWDRYLDFLLFRNLPAFSSTVMVKKARFETLGGFATDLIMETWDMACRLARDGGLRSVPEFLVLYRQHAGNRSRDVGAHRETGFRSLSRLFADPMLDVEIRRQHARIWARFYAMLAGGHLRNGEWSDCLEWAWRAVRTSPTVSGYLIGLPARRLKRALSPHRHRSFAEELSFAVCRKS